MDDRTRQNLLPRFRESAAERVEQIAAGLLRWEQGGGAAVRVETVNGGVRIRRKA